MISEEFTEDFTRGLRGPGPPGRVLAWARMAARSPRRSFARPFVITIGAAGLAACGPMAREPDTIANPPRATQSDEAYWKVETTAPGQCTVVTCAGSGAACQPETARPYPCIKDRASVVIIRHEGKTECAYNSVPDPEPEPCPPAVSCNPPPPEWRPIVVRCPDAP